MATINAAPVNAMPRARTVRSFSFGMKAITSAPTIGRNVAIVIAELSQVIGSSLSCSSRVCEDDHERYHADEDERGVALHVTGLDVLQETAERAGDGSDTVDDAVDHVTVEEH